MKKTAQYLAIGLASVVLLGGIALADTGSVGTTGPDSNNNITNNNNQNVDQENNNNVGVDNNSDQTCQSGSANTDSNTNAGGAQSGDATCENTTSTIVNIANGEGSFTPGKGAGPVQPAETATLASASVTAATSLPETGVASNWLASATIGSLAVVALKMSLEAMKRNAIF